MTVCGTQATLGEDQEPRNKAEDRKGNKIMPEPTAEPTVTTESLNAGPGSRLRLPIRRGYGRFGGFLESAVRLAQHPHERGPERPVLPQSIRSSARVRLRGQVAEACREQLQPAPCQGFAQASRGLMVARGGRMLAAISIGIIIIIAVIIAALAIIYFVLKGSPR